MIEANFELSNPPIPPEYAVLVLRALVNTVFLVLEEGAMIFLGVYFVGVAVVVDVVDVVVAVVAPVGSDVIVAVGF